MVGLHNGAAEVVQRLLSHKVDRAAAEPGAGQASAQHSFHLGGQLHQQVHLTAGNLKVLPQAVMRFVQEAAQRLRVASLEGGHGGGDTRLFCRHVTGAAVQTLLTGPRPGTNPGTPILSAV